MSRLTPMCQLTHDQHGCYGAAVGDNSITVTLTGRGFVWSTWPRAFDSSAPHATKDAAYRDALTTALQWHAAQVHAIADELRKLEVAI